MNKLMSENFSFFTYIQKEPQHKNEIILSSNSLILVTKGTKILHLENENINVDENHFLFLKSGSYLMSEVLDEYYEAMIFNYDDSVLLEFISKYNITFSKELIKEADILKLKKTAELKILIDSTCDYMRNTAIQNDQLIKLKLEEAFLNILNSSLAKEFKGFLYYIYKNNSFKILLEKHFSYEDNILDLADELKMTPLAFRQKFKEVYNTTPKKWQVIKRLEKAKVLLENTPKNVSEVCIECGFDNLSWFIQAFKKQYNLTPKQIKNNKN